MEMPYLVDAPGRQTDKSVRGSARWRSKAIEITWQKIGLGRAADNSRRNECSRIARQHGCAIESKRLRPKACRSSGVENVVRHIIAIRPNSEVRIIEKVGAEVESVA